MKTAFYFIKKLLSFSRYSIFVIFPLPFQMKSSDKIVIVMIL